MPRGRDVYRSAADLYSAAMTLRTCPTCEGGPPLVERTVGRFFCQSEQVEVTRRHVANMWIRFGYCPTCSAPLVKFGRRGDTVQRYRCRAEQRIFTEDSSAWRQLIRVSDDRTREAVVLLLMGWTTNRIQRHCRLKRSTALRFFGKNVYPEILDAAAELREDHLVLYYWVWKSLMTTWRLLSRAPNRRPPFRLPEFKPWRENVLFYEFVDRLAGVTDPGRIDQALRAVLLSFFDALMAAAKGQLAKRQIERYHERATEHLGELLGELFAPKRPADYRSPRTRCMTCGCRFSRIANPLVSRVDLSVHGSLCADFVDAVVRIRSLPNADRVVAGLASAATDSRQENRMDSSEWYQGFRTVGRERDRRRRQ